MLPSLQRIPMRQMYVYIMTNTTRTVLYTGVTNNLMRRVAEHKAGSTSSFTKRYNVSILVYCEEHESPESAIRREKQIKAGSRAKKESLIEKNNPGWRDLAEDWLLEQGE